MSDHNQRLLDHYARSNPTPMGGAARLDHLARACKFDEATTRYALEDARREYAMTGGKVVVRGASAPLGPIVQQLQEQSEGDDTITCLPYDGNDVYGDEIEIQKAIGLRKFDYDGAVYNGWTFAYVNSNTRTATKISDGTIETQRITPDYNDETNSTILGIKIIRGFDPETEEVDYIDMNLAGRVWAKDPQA